MRSIAVSGRLSKSKSRGDGLYLQLTLVEMLLGWWEVVSAQERCDRGSQLLEVYMWNHSPRISVCSIIFYRPVLLGHSCAGRFPECLTACIQSFGVLGVF